MSACHRRKFDFIAAHVCEITKGGIAQQGELIQPHFWVVKIMGFPAQKTWGFDNTSKVNTNGRNPGVRRRGCEGYSLTRRTVTYHAKEVVILKLLI